MASTYLTKTFSGAGNRKKWTWSAWVKKHQESGSGTYNSVLFGTAGGSYDTISFLTTPNSPKFFCNVAGNFERQTNAFHRDCFGWYHLVITFDSNQSTAADRLKMYVNGVQQSDFSDNTNGSQDADSYINSTDAHQIGKQAGLSRYGDFSMSHIHFCDGYAYAASDFGSTDSVTGEWSINTSPSVSYGTNGFFILKDGNSLTDQSPNTNNWSVGAGTLTKTEDCPSNVFCTANALSKGADTVLSNGNTTARNDTGNNSTTLGNIGFGNGKYYWEAYRHGGGNDGIGICLASVDGTSNTSVTNGRVLYYQDGTIFCEGLSDQSNINTGVSFADSDIISVSMDTENGVLKFYKNNTLVSNSTITNSKLTVAENIWVPHTYQSNGGEWRLNFGNGYFGTTAVSSAGTNASGNGIFEYDVQPTDATALSTKGLNL